MRDRLLIILFTWISLLYLNTLPANAQETIESLRQYLNHFLKHDSVVMPANVSFTLREIETQRILLGIQSDKSLTPASNLKLLTTITALDALGANFTFKTYLEYDGQITKDGILKGNIYVRGTGDPSLGSDRYAGCPNYQGFVQLMKDQLKALGLRTIEGSLIVDASMFDFLPLPDSWLYGDLGNYYGAAPFAFNINENKYNVFFKSGNQIGDSTTIVRTEPMMYGTTILNHVKTGASGSGDKSFLYAMPYANQIYSRGTIPLGSKEFVVKGAMPNPASVFLTSLKQALSDVQITVLGQNQVLYQKQSSDKSRTLIYQYTSPELLKLVRETNLQSINLYAEALLKAASMKFTGSTSYDSSTAWLKKYWKSKGMATAGMYLYDGSGLSPFNGITGAQLTYLLCYAKKQPWSDGFMSSLPIAGVSGTLWKIGKGTSAEGKIMAKTGTLTKVSCYSGFVNTQSGKTLSFSIMINGYEGKSALLAQKIEKLMVKMQQL